MTIGPAPMIRIDWRSVLFGIHHHREAVEQIADIVGPRTCLGMSLKAKRRPVSRSLTGWFAPWWPNFIFTVLAPEARPINWWPRQMPNTGMIVVSRISP